MDIQDPVDKGIEDPVIEAHEHKGRAVFDALRNAAGARCEPLFIGVDLAKGRDRTARVALITPESNHG